MGKRSRELKTGMTEEERMNNPNGNDQEPDMVEVVKIMNKYVKMERQIRKHMRVGRLV